MRGVCGTSNLNITLMNKPIHTTKVECSSGYNMSHVKNAPRHMRALCAYQDQTRLRVFETILRSVGGVASHGLCEAHYNEEISKTEPGVTEEINALKIDGEEARFNDKVQKWIPADYNNQRAMTLRAKYDNERRMNEARAQGIRNSFNQ